MAFCLPFATKAEEGPAPNGGLVEVRSNDQAYFSYSERRQTHGWQFALGRELYQPKNFVSHIDVNNTYETMYGTGDISVYYLETGYKLNVSAVSVSALVGYSSGQIKESSTGVTNSLTLERTNLKLMLAIDNVLAEPYVAPYVAVSMGETSIKEAEGDVDFSARTRVSMTTTAGLLLQLNWIEEESARWAWLNSGLENTYLDVFMTQYAKSSGEEDPDLSSGFNLGVGLRLEF